MAASTAIRVASADTVIIGAGAAGLGAAAELAAHGHSALLLEARERIGGRILTDYTTGSRVPAELGAEFIHGEPDLLLGWLERSGDVAIDAGGERWTAQSKGLRRADSELRDITRMLRRLAAPLGRDVSFAEFLRRHRRAIPAEVAQFAIRMVEGFDAADSTTISARSVIDEWSGPAAANAPTFRPARGYDALLQSIRHSLSADRASLQLGSVVRSISWRKGQVRIDARRHGEPVRIDAARAIVTLPLGVLQLPAASAHSVQFEPALRGKRRALAQLASGPVVKIVMNFSRPFWAEIDKGRYREAAFFFAPQAVFPTFWTTLPLRTSQLVAWCAGPRVERLAGKSSDQVVATALDSLRVLVAGRVDPASLLEHATWHDWQRDPFSGGAYSYVLAGGVRARRVLAEPLEETLFFAGEACDSDDSAATVGGALQSGVRAAREVLGSTRNRVKRTPRRSSPSRS
jgi:monoamine oxidase